jgi:glycine/D-amino acid oxidase-like deaminating enzyme
MSSSYSYPPPVPVPNATQPFWLTEPHPLANHRSTESLPTRCDILIIGAGYSGVATAYHLLSSRDERDKEKPSIVIIEAREACSGATGRNGGQVKPDLYTNIPALSKKYGAVEAAEFAKFEAKNVLAVKALVEKEEIDCDFQLTRSVDVYLDSTHAEAVEESYRELVKQGIAELGDVMFWKGRGAEEVSGTLWGKGRQ